MTPVYASNTHLICLSNNKFDDQCIKKLQLKFNNNNIDINMKRMDNYHTINVSEPWFSLISLGIKTVEGRKNKGVFMNLQIGDKIKWTNSELFFREILTEVIGKNTYPTFKEYLETEGLENCLPSIKNIDQGVDVYYKYYTKQDEIDFGVVAIRIKVIQN